MNYLSKILGMISTLPLLYGMEMPEHDFQLQIALVASFHEKLLLDDALLAQYLQESELLDDRSALVIQSPTQESSGSNTRIDVKPISQVTTSSPQLDKCTICDDVQANKETPCCHKRSICVGCWTVWTQDKHTCPFCRQAV